MSIVEGQGAARPANACKVPIKPPDGAAILTVPEAAWVLRVSVDTVFRLINRGEMASTSVGRKRFVPAAEIAAYRDRQTTVRRPDAKAAEPARIGLRESGLWDGEEY